MSQQPLACEQEKRGVFWLLSSQNNPNPRADSPASLRSYAISGQVPATLEQSLPCPAASPSKRSGQPVQAPQTQALSPLAHGSLGSPETQLIFAFGLLNQCLDQRPAGGKRAGSELGHCPHSCLRASRLPSSCFGLCVLASVPLCLPLSLRPSLSLPS